MSFKVKAEVRYNEKVGVKIVKTRERVSGSTRIHKEVPKEFAKAEEDCKKRMKKYVDQFVSCVNKLFSEGTITSKESAESICERELMNDEPVCYYETELAQECSGYPEGKCEVSSVETHWLQPKIKILSVSEESKPKTTSKK